MTLAEQRRERITMLLFFALGIAGLLYGWQTKQTDNPTMYAASAVRG